MLNRYSKIPQYVVKNNQVLTDLGIIDTALQRKQKAYDTKAATIGSAVQGAESMQFFGDAANAKKASVVADLKNKVGEISSMDLADPNVTKGVDTYIQQASADPELKKHTQAATLHNEYLETQKKLSESGKLPTSADYLRQKAWKDYSDKGILSNEATEPLYEAQDLVKGRGDLVSMIKASGTDIIASLSDGTAYKNSSKGVASDRIRKAVEAQLPTYMNSAYGRQEADDYKVAKMQGSIPKDMSFGQYLTNQVMSTAANYSYSDFSTNMDGALNSSRKEKLDAAKEEKERFTGSGYTPAIGVTPDVEIDSDDRIDQPWYMDAKDYFAGGDSRPVEVKAHEAKIEANMKAAGFKGTKKEYAEQVLNTDPNIKVNYYSAKEADTVSKKFWNGSTKGGTFINTRVWDEANRTWLPALEYMNKYDITKEEMDKGFTITGELSPDNPLTPKGYQAVVGGKSLILDNSNSGTTFEEEYVHKAGKARTNGEGSTTFVMRDPKTKQPYRHTIRVDASGNFMQPKEERISEAEFNKENN